MIGLSRLKRAIADVPTGGMQTGDPKVWLKLCDAQRLEVEFNAIIAERDNALARNAELVAMAEAFKSALFQCVDLVPAHFYNDAFASAKKIIDATPAQHLRDRDAEVGRAGFVAGFEKCIKDHNIVFIASNYIGHSENYAGEVRRGEVCLKSGD